MLQSSRLKINYPNPATRADSADVPRDIKSLVDVIETCVIYGQGVIAARPVSTPGVPGIQGRVYMSTDESPNVFYYDLGTSWVSVGSIAVGSVGTSQLADHCVTEIKLAIPAVGTPEIFDGAVTSAKILDGTIVAGDLAAALKPSQGAGAGTEALRALGAAAGLAAPGLHASQHDKSSPDALLANSISPAMPDSTATFNFARLKQGGMDVQRTPQGTNRHMESGRLTAAYLGFSSSAGGSASFVDPFSVAPIVVFAVDNGNPPPDTLGVSAVSTTSWTINSYSAGSPGWTWGIGWIAEGAD